MKGIVVTSTGTKGFLTWLKAAQPDLYKKIAPQIMAKAIAGQNNNTMSGLLGCIPQRGMGAFADGYASYATLTTGGDTTTISNPGFSDLNIAPTTTTSTDPASVASTSPTSNALATTISALANAYSSATLTSAQVSANNTILQTNLARAQQGLPPLTTATSSTGLTSVTGTDMTPILLIGGAALLLVLLGGKSSASA